LPGVRLCRESSTLMNTQLLVETANRLVDDDKGILAMDESPTTCNRRFARLNIPQTVEHRRTYRELLLTTPGLGKCISGVILCDETMRQHKADGTPFLELARLAGILTGIKVDLGTTDLAAHPGELITEGLDGLRERFQEAFRLGARFSKWRSVIPIGADVPSRSGLEANAQALARFAALSQEAGLVPIVEPEVLAVGEHTLEECRKVTQEVLRNVLIQINCQRVLLEGLILKPNMVLPGLSCPISATVEEVANATLMCLWRTVPVAIPGIAFLSGGQPAQLASAHLNAMNCRYKSRQPWQLSFSYGRALQQPALDVWRGESANVEAAQKVLMHRARCNRAARRGEYTAEMECQ
jgi:fructose-bisphosphate aldolase, class I